MAGTVTSLVVQKRNKERVNVFIDGEFAFGLAMIEALKLKKGQHLSDEDIARLRALDEIEVARDKALNYLSFRPRSTEEVRRNLREKGISDTAIEEAISRLQRAGLLDDEAFVRFWIENRQQFKPRSARALRYELRQKGVADGVLDAMLVQVDEDSAAYQAGLKRARRYREQDEKTFRKKLADFLARRGFNYSTIRDVVDRLWQERQEESTT